MTDTNAPQLPGLAEPEVSPEPPVPDRSPAWWRGRDPVRWLLAPMVAAWFLVFSVLIWIRHERFGTFGFDLGVYDQAVWLLSAFEDPFITIRGLDLFGFHMNLLLCLLAPFYWLGAGPHFLNIVQIGAQASGAVAMYLLGRDRLDDRWLAVGMAAVLLLHPSYQFLAWETFHPDTMAIAPMLFAYWAARVRRWRLFTVAVVLALACKEDMALAVAVLGVLVAVRGNRVIGAVTSVLAVAWFLVATRVILPSVNGIAAFYDSFFGDFGGSPTEVARTVITNPGKAWSTATLPDRLNYYRLLLAPLAFVPLLALPTLSIGGPMLAVNVLSTFPYQRDIMYHHVALVLVAIMAATVEAIAAAAHRRRSRIMGALVIAASLGGSALWGPLGGEFSRGLWALLPDATRPAKQEALSRIPDGAPVSAIYYLVPHLSQRQRIYEFPVPWQPTNWGVRGENLHDPAVVRWIAIDRRLLSPQDTRLLNDLLSHEFVSRYERDGILVAERVQAARASHDRPPLDGPGPPRDRS